MTASPRPSRVRRLVAGAAVAVLGASVLAGAPVGAVSGPAVPAVTKARAGVVEGLLQDLQTELGTRFAGAWLDGAGIAHIGFAGRDQAAAARADARLAALAREPGVVFEQRTFTTGALDRALDRVVARLHGVLPRQAPDGAESFDGAVDTPGNRVTVTVNTAFASKKAAVERALAGDLASGVVALRWGGTTRQTTRACEERFSAPCTPLRGGLSMLPFPVGGYCTSGFVMRAPSGVRVLSTAGHCYFADYRVGDVPHAVTTIHRVNSGAIDAQSLSLKNANMPVPSNEVFRDGDHAARITLKITNPGFSLIMNNICSEGTITGTSCGGLLNYNATWQGRTGFGLTVGRSCEGDSGAPMINNDTRRAYGLLAGGAEGEPCGSPTYFSWINRIEAALGYTVLLTTTTESLGAAHTLFPDQYLQSADGRYQAWMQGDGNFVIYGPGWVPIFATSTAGRPGTIAALQSDGNFVLYAPGHVPIWSTNTSGHPGSLLTMRNDGNLVVVGPGNVVLWESLVRAI